MIKTQEHVGYEADDFARSIVTEKGRKDSVAAPRPEQNHIRAGLGVHTVAAPQSVVLLQSILESPNIPVVLIVLGFPAQGTANLVIHETAGRTIHTEALGF